MTETIHRLIEQYGLVAVFLGCVAEGESAAVLAGFFAHQAVFVPWQAFAAAFAGAFTGDTLFFLAGRRFSGHDWVARLKQRPGFSHAHRALIEHPDLFVLANRFVYGFRLIGGVTAGLSGIAVPRFLALNAASSAIWASLFCTAGYVFGAGAQTLLAGELHRHQRLLVALGLGLAVAVAAGLVAHRRAKRTG